MEKNKVGSYGIIALVLGIIAIITSYTITFGIVCAIISIVLSVVAVKRKEKTNIAITGIILSVIGIIISIAIIILSSIILEEVVIGNNNIAENFKGAIQIRDEISGKKLIEKDGKMLLELKEDTTFKYYKDKDVTDNNYFAGKYVLYNGSNIKEYIENNKDVRFVSSLEKMIEKVNYADLPNTYYLILKNEEQIVNNKNMLSEVIDNAYFGTYNIEANVLTLINMKNANIYNFIVEN